MVTEATKRKPSDFEDLTFFSEEDVWLYDATLDSKVCVLCRTAEDIEQFRGNNLRMNFPYLEIIDKITIRPKVHPNCRCVLIRLLVKQEPIHPKE